MAQNNNRKDNNGRSNQQQTQEKSRQQQAPSARGAQAKRNPAERGLSASSAKARNQSTALKESS